MRKYITILLVAVVVVVAAWLFLGRRSPHGSFDSSQNVLPPDTRRVLEAGERFVLLSLDPTHPALRRKSLTPKAVMRSLPALFGRLFFTGLSSALFFVSPEMECVGENDVGEHVMRAVVGDVDRGIDLQISRQIAGDTNRG